MDIRFADHPSFQRAAAGMVGGALVFGLALHPVTAAAPLIGGGLGIVAGVVIGRGQARWPRGRAGLAGLVFGAGAIVVAMWCAMRIGMARQTAPWPALVRTMVAAAAVGVVGALALLPRHLRLVSDPVRGALGKQRYRDHIKQRRERLVARMHNHVAALEKFELAATDLSSAHAARAGSLAVSQLEELSHDVTASGDALAELEMGSAADLG